VFLAKRKLYTRDIFHVFDRVRIPGDVDQHSELMSITIPK